MDHSFRSNCVLCDSEKLKVVLNFKKTPLANSYERSLNNKNKLYNLSTVLCETCGHLQLKELITDCIEKLQEIENINNQ